MNRAMAYDYAQAVGLKFHRWTVLAVGVDPRRRVSMRVQCECGEIHTRDACNVVRGKSRCCTRCGWRRPCDYNRALLAHVPMLPIAAVRGRNRDAHAWTEETRRDRTGVTTAKVCTRCGMEAGWPGGRNPCGQPIDRTTTIAPPSEYDNVAAA